MFTQFYSLSDETNFENNDDNDDNNDGKLRNCKYYDLEQLQAIKIPRRKTLKMFHINPRKTPWRRFGRRETIMTYEKPFLIRIKKIVKIILKTNNNLESWVTTTTFLLEFHAEANQSKFLKFYPLLKYLKPLKHMDSVSSCWHRSSLGITVMYSISKV